MSAVALNWNLDTTANSALILARNLVLAATNDNVQPLAIAACERFGNTIAMCDETCKKMESLIRKTPEHVVVEFLKASIGFDMNDTATLLSKNRAGIQFLGLAAALTSTMEVYAAATCLQGMLLDSASDRTMVSTIRQLNDLLQVLQPRLADSGFLNSVIGWHKLLYHQIRTKASIRCLCPDDDGIKGLVNAFRQLARVGDSDVSGINISIHRSAAWVITFVKWSLGLPPSIYLESKGLVFNQPGSQVTVFIVDALDRTRDMTIEITYSVARPADLIATSCADACIGMVNVKEFGLFTLLDLGFGHELALQALHQALPHALAKIIHGLQITSDYNFKKPADGRLEHRELRLRPFPKDHTIIETMSTYLDISSRVQSLDPDSVDIFDLPLVKPYLFRIQEQCKCSSCKPESTLRLRCQKQNFLQNMAFICTDILVLSLFAGPTRPLVYLQRQNIGSQTSLANAIEAAMTSGGPSLIEVSRLFNYALDLVGHPDIKVKDWVMSGFRGQVVYPQLFESMCYKKEGFLTLNWLPGMLRYREEVYTTVTSIGPASYRSLASNIDYKSIAVKEPCCLAQTTELSWQIVQGNRTLNANLGLSGQPRYISLRSIFETLADAVMVEACSHAPKSALQVPDQFAVYAPPDDPRFEDGKTKQRGTTLTSLGESPIISVVAVDGRDDLRFFTLAHKEKLVLRKDSCLSCCLDVCRMVGYDILVL